MIKTDEEVRIKNIGVYPELFRELDGLREVYSDGRKETWNHFMETARDAVKEKKQEEKTR